MYVIFIHIFYQTLYTDTIDRYDIYVNKTHLINDDSQVISFFKRFIYLKTERERGRE